jgi:indole-3-glycerol phosphate synthase
MSILEQILREKRHEVARWRAEWSAGALERAMEARDPVRGFRAALAPYPTSREAIERDPCGGREPGQPIRAIAEIKRASPSAGPIRPGADAVEVALEYQRAGASAISVLTDESFFDGRIEDLDRVRDAVRLPLLRKDFLIDPDQVLESRVAGADAVLLIVAALPGDQLGELLAAASECGLDALVEVHDQREAERAIDAGAGMVGINHRNLSTFEMDMELTARLAPSCPPGTVLVAESGIRTAKDVTAMADAGAHAILVGESLMRAASPGAALAELLGRTEARG